jgi:hypothetical protein
MPDLDQIKQGEQEVRDRRGRFSKGRSGNLADRPRGCREHVNRGARLLLAGEGEALTRKAVELALAGDPWAFSPRAGPVGALRLCLERIVGPYRERVVEFTMPPIRNAADLTGAMAAVADAAADGAVTPRKAMQLGHLVEACVRAVEATKFEWRLSLAFVSPTKPPRPSTPSPTRRNCRAPTATVRPLPNCWPERSPSHRRNEPCRASCARWVHCFATLAMTRSADRRTLMLAIVFQV